MGTAILENPGLGNVLASDGAPTVRSLPHALELPEELQVLQDTPVPASLKPAVEPAALRHRGFDDTEFWRRYPATRTSIARPSWTTSSRTSRASPAIDKLEAVLGNRWSRAAFLDDVRAGIERAPMNLRLSPYIVALIDWADPYRDPLRIQFVPVASTQLPDHPRLSLDSLHEQADAPTPGLTHRYHDKALFLPLDVCPVYCRFCTRSYAIGGDTDTVEQGAPEARRRALALGHRLPGLASRNRGRGGLRRRRLYMLPAAHLEHASAHLLLAIPHIRRIRIATKGPAVSPMKILTDDAWTDALFDWRADAGRRGQGSLPAHPLQQPDRDQLEITREAMDVLFRERRHGAQPERADPRRQRLRLRR